MRACDHTVIRDLFATEYVYPNPWYEGGAKGIKNIRIPAQYCTHPVPDDLDRCK